MNKKRVKIILLSLSFVLFSVSVHSEIPPQPLPGETPPPGLPIDAGLSFLLASGVAYGIYALKRKK